MSAGLLAALSPQVRDLFSSTNPHHGTQDLSVPAEGTEEFVQIDGQPRGFALHFDAAGIYRIELRALDGTADPVLTLFDDESDVLVATNDDAAGTLDSYLPLRVTDTDDRWRIEVTSLGETGGPSVLRILPTREGEDLAMMPGGPGAFPSGDVSELHSGDLIEATVGRAGVWYRFQPAVSGVHTLAIRAANDEFDTVAALVPVLEGQEAPPPGTDISSISGTFTSDDDDGLNPHFVRYLQAGADYYLFIYSFEDAAEGSIAISLVPGDAETGLLRPAEPDSMENEGH